MISHHNMKLIMEKSSKCKFISYGRPSLRASSVCSRCSSCGYHPLPRSPTGGSVLKAGVCVQRQPFVSHSHPALVDTVLLWNAWENVHVSCLVSSFTSSILTGRILWSGQRTGVNFLTWTGWLSRGGSSPLLHSTRQTMAPTAAKPATT